MAKWIELEDEIIDGDFYYECSECGTRENDGTLKECPCCGARMVQKEG